jgi:hypothetical protein
LQHVIGRALGAIASELHLPHRLTEARRDFELVTLRSKEEALFVARTPRLDAPTACSGTTRDIALPAGEWIAVVRNQNVRDTIALAECEAELLVRRVRSAPHFEVRASNALRSRLFPPRIRFAGAPRCQEQLSGFVPALRGIQHTPDYSRFDPEPARGIYADAGAADDFVIDAQTPCDRLLLELE